MFKVEYTNGKNEYISINKVSQKVMEKWLTIKSKKHNIDVFIVSKNIDNVGS